MGVNYITSRLSSNNRATRGIRFFWYFFILTKSFDSINLSSNRLPTCLFPKANRNELHSVGFNPINRAIPFVDKDTGETFQYQSFQWAFSYERIKPGCVFGSSSHDLCSRRRSSRREGKKLSLLDRIPVN